MQNATWGLVVLQTDCRAWSLRKHGDWCGAPIPPQPDTVYSPEKSAAPVLSQNLGFSRHAVSGLALLDTALPMLLGEEGCNNVSIKIETSRLTLRPWDEEDIEQLTLSLNDPTVAKWLAFVPHPYSTSHAKDWVKRCQEISSAGGRPVAYEFALELRHERLVIGGVSLNKIDWDAGTGGGGIWIANGYQGCGYGREAFEAKIRFAFCELGLTKLINGYFDGNENSWAMQRNLGYRRVAEAPSRCMADGRQTIEHVTMLLRSDWKDREG